MRTIRLSPIHLALCSALVAILLAAASAAAHVTVSPREVRPNTSETFSVRVPTERDEPTVRVRVEFPATITVSRFQPKPGWQRQLDRDGSGRITAVTWSGGRIEPAEFEDFVFMARTPADVGALSFRAIQTYASGETHEWVEAEGAARPAAIVEVKAAVAASTSAATDDHNRPVATAPSTGAASAVTVFATAAANSAAAAATSRAAGASGSIGENDVPVSAGSSDLPLFVALASGALALVAVALSGVALARRPQPAP